MHICLVYDCLFPWTIGGAERWYRNLGERLAAEGHAVTYLTLRQWEEPPQIDGVEVVAVGPRMALYRNGKRRIAPPLRFGWGVFLHLLARGGRYDVVHTASFPFFSLLAAGICRPLKRYRILCDWHEVWSRSYWREYLGVLGWVGELVQRLCARVPQRAYTFSRLHAERLRGLGVRDVTHLTGEYVEGAGGAQLASASAPPQVVFAGRFIPEKRVGLLVAALDLAFRSNPTLRATLFGDGPEREAVLRDVEERGLGSVIACPGFVETETVDRAMREAVCIVQPSSREGYGMVVVEASARGVPAIAIAGPDNAAPELIDDGRNGFVVGAPDPALLADAILACAAAGDPLRASTRDWYDDNRDRVSLECSLRTVAEDYGTQIR